MKTSIRDVAMALFWGALITLSALNPAFAEERKDMGGWEPDSPYNRHYDDTELDSFKGLVDKIVEIVPMPGMSPGVGIVIRESKDEKTLVHVCPTWYIDTNGTGLKKGDRVKVKGVWATIDDQDVFMASKIKKGDYFQLKVRLTKNGRPFWAMDPEELAREKAGQ